jgi:2-haloalkanoic acid dehalogenase type II
MTAASRNAEAPGLLADVDLVTFDCFGTLVDWEKALPALGVEPSRLPQFLSESVGWQRATHRDAPFVTYREVLARVGATLRPDLERARITMWARAFGELPLFSDTLGALRLLRETVDVGVISNCDLVHQVDVERRLGRPWDVCVVAEELGAYKPTDRAWDSAIARVLARGYELDRWLHVSAWDDYDLQPASARGVRTVYVPRPGGVEPEPGAVDLRFDGLDALANAIAAAKDGPVEYVVTTTLGSDDATARYAAWMLGEHFAAVRACAGVRGAELVQLDARRIRARYRFRSRAALDRYLERDAPRLRASTAERFHEDEISWERDFAKVLASR